MKKHLFIIILTILSSFSYAQLVDGSPFNFSSLNATQYNPGYHPLEDNPSNSNMWVVATREDEDLRGLASGIYIYTIRYEQHIETRKLIITK